jgi:hypothetical protein
MSGEEAKTGTLLSLALAIVAFALAVPITCVGSSDRSREWCETALGWRLPWSSIGGTSGAVAMYVAPLLAAVATFLLTRAIVRRRNAAATRAGA